jgi:hypothetical protein
MALVPTFELGCQLPRDRVFVHETREKSLTEEPHERLAVPALEALEGAIWGEAAVGHENVPVAIPLQEVTRGGDRDDDPRPDVGSELPAYVLG